MKAVLLVVLLQLGLVGLASADDAFDEARQLRQQGRFGEAVAVLDGAVAAGRTDGRLDGLLGLCLLDAGLRERADTLAERLSGYTGGDHRVHVFLARHLEMSGDAQAAVASYREALKHHDAVEAHFGLINLFMMSGRLGKAYRQAEELARLQPDRGGRMLAAVLAAQGDRYVSAGGEAISLAVDKYTAALELIPGDPGLAERALEVMLLAVRVDEARQLVDDVFGSPDVGATAAYWHGRVRAAELDTDGARVLYERALEGEPTHQGALLALTRLSLDEGDPDGARAWLARCDPALPVTTRQLVMRGEIAETLGDLDDAERHLRRALEQEPEHGKALYALGRLLLRLDRPDEGRELLARFQEVRSRIYEEEEH